MNYYIQGDAANADQIKAAFEKLGYNTGYLGFTSDQLYYTVEGKVELMCTKSLQNLIKTHPDYKELELPVEPTFKEGDWIAGIDDEGDVATEKIVCFMRNKVLLVDIDGCFTEYPKTELNNFHLWTIADAKDGDVLVTTKIRNCPFIYRKTDRKNNLAYYYAGIDGDGDFSEGCLKRTLCHFGLVSDVIPATKEQRDLLFQKMKEAGYEWDEKKKELRKIKPHYDIANFKPFDKVLERNYDTDSWTADLFSHYVDDEDGKAFVTICSYRNQCIPYEGNEHLLGTTDMCDEMYINW